MTDRHDDSMHRETWRIDGLNLKGEKYGLLSP